MTNAPFGTSLGNGMTLDRARAGAGESLADLRAGRDGLVGVEQDDVAGLVVGAEHEDFRHERADLLRRKIDDRDDPAADQLAGTVVRGDLGARALDAERTEVDPEPVGRSPRLGELPRVGDDANTHLYLLEVGPGDRHRACGAPSEPSVVPG